MLIKLTISGGTLCALRFVADLRVEPFLRFLSLRIRAKLCVGGADPLAWLPNTLGISPPGPGCRAAGRRRVAAAGPRFTPPPLAWVPGPGLGACWLSPPSVRALAWRESLAWAGVIGPPPKPRPGRGGGPQKSDSKQSKSMERGFCGARGVSSFFFLGSAARRGANRYPPP